MAIEQSAWFSYRTHVLYRSDRCQVMTQTIARPGPVTAEAAVRPRPAVDLMATSFAIEGQEAGVVSAIDARRVGHIRRIVAARLVYLGLSALRDCALTIVSELVTNAIQHSGRSGGSSPSVTVTQLYARGQLHILVKDAGGGRPQVGDADTEAESGRGLWIVELITAEVGGRWGFAPDSRTTYCVLPAATATP
ncbi:ATP-binding protein [Streptomyces vinaceus]|uniref:ATP-binding protein n=1 Tax=Streptomyces vinaceus TaxID=1960 RepID=UPI0036B5DA9A